MISTATHHINIVTSTWLKSPMVTSDCPIFLKRKPLWDSLCISLKRVCPKACKWVPNTCIPGIPLLAIRGMSWWLRGLLGQLCHPLGLTKVHTVQQVIEQTTPGAPLSLRGFLQRLPIKQFRTTTPSSASASLILAKKLSTFISIKGEDILLQAPTEGSIKFHRLRASIPAKLWKWRSVAGWAWKSQEAHINELELRAVLTTLSWRLERRRETQSRCIHLVDSLVCLHCLSRGRSSSKKLRRVLSQINALILCADAHPVWAYVATKQNPADRPSRRFHHAKKRRKS